MQEVQNIQLPQLRPDLEFLKAPDANGSPVTTIYDPVAGIYEQADWRQMEIISRIPKFSTLCELAADISENTTLRFSNEELGAFILGLVNKGLTRSTMTKNVAQLNYEKGMRDVGLIKKMIHSYLYFRVPLVKPDRFLKATLPFVSVFASRLAFWIYTLAFMFGVYGILLRFDEYVNTFHRFFSFDGIIIYSVVIIGVKLVHEFAHSYTAKAYGVRVPTMGAAFIVMWPVAFSDVTDAWRLSKRRERFMISAAGVISELCIGALSLCLWQFSSPGIWQSIFFVLSSVTILSTLLMNLNPAMRFDGYYMMLDILRIDNLQSRAFEYTKWLYRKTLLGFQHVCPESQCSAAKQKVMVVYSLVVWVYRFFLYLGIAVMVYYKFTKMLGLFLFAVEIYMFIVMPLIREVKVLKTESSQFKRSKRWIFTICLLGLACAYAVVPISHTKIIPALAVAAEKQLVYAPYSGVVKQVGLVAGAQVNKGDLLLEVYSADLEFEYRSITAKAASSKFALDALVSDASKRDQLRQVSEEYKQLSARKEQLEQLLKQRTIHASHSGSTVFLDDGIREGVFLRKRALVAELNGEKRFVVAYLPESDSEELEVGQEITFVSDAYDAEVQGTVSMVSPIAEEFLEYPQLGSVYGGKIAVTSAQHKMRMVDSYYKVEIQLEDNAQLRSGQSGRVSFMTRPKSRIWNTLKRSYIALIRELNI